MKASEAKEKTSLARTVKSMGKVFEKISIESIAGIDYCDFGYSELSPDQIKALQSLGYVVSDARYSCDDDGHYKRVSWS